MTESQFIAKNSDHWRRLEDLLQQSDKDPDELHTLFIKVSSDLSYARTYFPNRSVRIYLNNLTQEVFDSIRSKERKPRISGFFKFFTETLPIEVYKARSAFWVSLIVFGIAVTIGVVSTIQDEDFTRTIIGDDYVDMTEENIANGDPMAVYKDDDMMGMQLAITFNNIRVSFLAFVLGIFGGVGTIYVLVSNGIMLGTFQYFFVTKQLFWTSFLTIWIHGTIEISAIIIAGAAGLTLGSGILFPGTYPRSTALQIHAKRAITIILGTVPLFIIAGLLESYVTRETEFPDAIKAGIIIISFLFIVLMWIVLPLRVARTPRLKALAVDPPPFHAPELVYQKHAVRTMSQNINTAMRQLKGFLSHQYQKIIIPNILLIGATGWYLLTIRDTSTYELSEDQVSLFTVEEGGISLFVIYTLMISLNFLLLANYNIQSRLKLQDVMYTIKVHLWKFVILTLVWFAPLYLIQNNWWGILWILVVSPQFILSTYDGFLEGDNFREVMISRFNNAWSYYSHFILVLLVGAGFTGVLYLLAISPVAGMLSQMLSWHNMFEYKALDNTFIFHLLGMLALFTAIPFLYFIYNNTYYSAICERTSADLKERLKTFGQDSSILESK